MAKCCCVAKYAFDSVWAEQNGAIVTDRWNFSFGNGNESTATADPVDWGFVTHLDYDIVSMSVGSRLTNTAETEIEFTVNTLSVGESIIIPGNQTKATRELTPFYNGSKGDTLNFRTLQVGGGNDVVPSVLIRWHLPPHFLK